MSCTPPPQLERSRSSLGDSGGWGGVGCGETHHFCPHGGKSAEKRGRVSIGQEEQASDTPSPVVPESRAPSPPPPRKETRGWEGVSSSGPSSSGAAGHAVECMRGQTRTPSCAPGCRSRTLGPRVAPTGGCTLPLPLLGGSHSPYTPTRTPRGPGVLQGGWVKSEQRCLPREPRGLATGPCAREREG